MSTYKNTAYCGSRIGLNPFHRRMTSDDVRDLSCEPAIEHDSIVMYAKNSTLRLQHLWGQAEWLGRDILPRTGVFRSSNTPDWLRLKTKTAEGDARSTAIVSIFPSRSLVSAFQQRICINDRISHENIRRLDIKSSGLVYSFSVAGGEGQPRGRFLKNSRNGFSKYVIEDQRLSNTNVNRFPKWTLAFRNSSKYPTNFRANF